MCYRGPQQFWSEWPLIIRILQDVFFPEYIPIEDTKFNVSKKAKNVRYVTLGFRCNVIIYIHHTMMMIYPHIYIWYPHLGTGSCVSVSQPPAEVCLTDLAWDYPGV